MTRVYKINTEENIFVYLKEISGQKRILIEYNSHIFAFSIENSIQLIEKIKEILISDVEKVCDEAKEDIGDL